MKQRRFLLVIAILVVCFFSNFRVSASDDQVFDRKDDWKFTINDDLTVDVLLSETVYPPPDGLNYSSFCFYQGDSRYVSFEAYDYETGKELRTETMENAGWMNVTVWFDSLKLNEYKFKLEFRMENRVSKESDILYYFPWSWGGTDKPLPQNVTIILPQECDVELIRGIKLSEWRSHVESGNVVVTFGGVAPAKGYFEWTLYFTTKAHALNVPLAVFKPKINGKYTPLEGLEINEIAKNSEWLDEVENEWNDALEIGYKMWLRGIDPDTKPEWYLGLKHDEEFLYIIVDGVSDHQIGEKVGYRDSRQMFDFWFDTMNAGPSSITGLYHMELYFTSPDNLAFGQKYRITGIVPSFVPRESCSYDWSISESPRSSAPHIIIEIAVDLKLLTKYYGTILCSFYASDIDINMLRYENFLNLLGKDIIPELKLDAIQALRQANASIEQAIDEGRTEGIDKAELLLVNATVAFSRGEYAHATDFAERSREAADAAMHPQNYFEAKELLSRARELKSEALASNFTSPEAQGLIQQALSVHDSAEKAFLSNEFAPATDYARKAIALFENAVATEQSYRELLEEKSRREEQEAHRQMLNYIAVCGAVVGIASLYIFRKKVRIK